MYLQRFRADTARGVERPFGDPLKSMRAWTRQVPKRDIDLNGYTVVVELPDLGVRAHLVGLPRDLQSIPAGTRLLVNCHSIDLGIKRLHMDVTLADPASVVPPDAI